MHHFEIVQDNCVEFLVMRSSIHFGAECDEMYTSAARQFMLGDEVRGGGIAAGLSDVRTRPSGELSSTNERVTNGFDGSPLGAHPISVVGRDSPAPVLEARSASSYQVLLNERQSTRQKTPPSAKAKRKKVRGDPHHYDRIRQRGLDDEQLHFSRSELETMDETLQFVVPTADHLQDIARRASANLRADRTQLACCVCELLYPENEIDRKPLTDELIANMCRCLGIDESADIPEFIKTQYDASQFDERLRGLMLHPGAFQREYGLVVVQVCGKCDEHISERRAKAPPLFAIANGNYIGRLPFEFSNMTRTDEQAVALVSPCMSLSTVTGGSCKTIKSHHYVVKNTEGAIVSMLPRDLNAVVRVTMVGSMTSAQQAACKRRYEMNVDLCRSFLQFLVQNNREYATRRNDLTITSTNASKTTVVIDRTNNSPSPVADETIVSDLRDNSTYSTFGSTVAEGSDPAIEQTWVAPSSLIMEQQQPGIDVLVRKSNAYVSAPSWESCVLMFPTLFPGGCGGPKEKRRRRLSVRKWVLRCLRVDGLNFEKHYAFLLLAFDFLAMKNARKALYVKLHVSKEALNAGNIKQETIMKSIEYHKHLVDAKSKGVKPKPPPPEIADVVNLRKGLASSESAYYGSNLSRYRARHNLFGFLKRFGTIQIFFTVSPDSAGTYTIAMKSGELSKEAVDAANLSLLPNRAERKSIAAQHPMQCALYFDKVMTTIIEELLGWDMARNRPKRSGGIFGVVKGFGAAAETQQAGDLHGHFVVWLHGFPTTAHKLGDELGGNPDFFGRILEFADTITTCKIPILNEENKCIRETCGVLTPVKLGVDAFRRPLHGSKPPITSCCDTCAAEYRDRDVINAAIEIAAERTRVNISPASLDYFKCSGPSSDTTNDGKAKLVATIVIRDVQVHFWTHAKSCFKVTVRTPKGSVCRFFRPADVHLGRTSIDDAFNVLLHRAIGCEYVNPYNPILLDVLKCNHDVRLVLGCGSKDIAAYICKYCMKSQHPLENSIAYSLAAFNKAVSKPSSVDPDIPAENRGYKIFSSMLYTVTNGQEVAAPMAALYLLHPPFWFSHDMVFVNMERLMDKVSATQELRVFSHPRDNGTFSFDSLSQLEKYWKRPLELENMNFATICEDYELDLTSKKKAKAGRESNLQFVGYKKSSAHKVLVISGKQLPDNSSELSPEDEYFYYLTALTLFKPHRKETLLHLNESVNAAYQSFLTSTSFESISQLRNFEATWLDFYRSQQNDDGNEESAEAELLRTRAPPKTSWWYEPDELEENEFDNDFDDELVDADDFFSMDIDGEKCMTRDLEFVRNDPELRDAVRNTCKAYPISDEIFSPPDSTMEQYFSDLITSERRLAESETMGTTQFLDTFQDARTRLERLTECFEPVPWPNRDREDESLLAECDLPPFPKIAEVSVAYNLNLWQHVMFEMATRHLLFAYLKDIENESKTPLFPVNHRRPPYAIKEQLVGFLGGEAGTGKSRVIHAILFFAEKWGRGGTVETIAYTGVAAININGKTMHSSRNLKLGGHGQNAAPTLKMRAKFGQVVLVIIDEISMTDQALLGSTDLASRGMTDTPRRIMGGKHVIFGGDWLQLPPVRGVSGKKTLVPTLWLLLKECDELTRIATFNCLTAHVEPKDTDSRYHHAGFEIYRAINFVVFLTENMRARVDPKYCEILTEVRWGNVTEENLELLNTRLHAYCTSEDEKRPELLPFFRPIVTTTNKVRCALNKAMIFDFVERNRAVIYECRARSNARSKAIFDKIINFNDDITGRVAMRLYFFIGMPVMVTRKHPKLKGSEVIANGTVGTIVGFAPEDQVCIETTVAGMTLKRLVNPPNLLFIRVHECSKTLVRGFPPGVIGIPTMAFQVKTLIPNLSKTTITVHQFPLVASFALTTEKLQGKTCSDGIVVTKLERQGGLPPQSLYVALSRTVSLAKLSLLTPLSQAFLKKFRPSAEAAAEMKRLQRAIQFPPYTSISDEADFLYWLARQDPKSARQS